MGSWLRKAWVVGLALVLCGCERLMINNVNQVSADLTAASERYDRALAVIMAPGLFEALGERTTQLQLGKWESWAWSGGAVGGFVGGAEVSVGPLDATFKRQSVSVIPLEGGGGIRVVVKYRAPLIPVRLLYRDEAGGTQLCKLDLDLRQRQVTLDLVPSVGPQGQPVWGVGALNGLVGDEPLTYALTEDCSLDVGAFDWVSLSSQVTGLLSVHLQGAVVPGLREDLVAMLGLPAGSVTISRGADGFYEPRAMTLTSTVSEAGPWNGASFDVLASGWLRLALDVGLPTQASLVGDEARCSAPLPEVEAQAPGLLTALDIPTQTPSGQPYHMLWWIEEGVFARFFYRLVTAGNLCADLLPSAQNLSTFTLLLAPVAGLDDAVRLRVQPLQHLSVEVAGAQTLRIKTTLRIDIYGVFEGTLTRWATLDLIVNADLRPILDAAFGMRFEVEAVATQLATADAAMIQSLSPGALNLERLTGGLLNYLVQSHLRWPLVRAFDQRFEVTELANHDGRIAIYLRLAE